MAVLVDDGVSSVESWCVGGILRGGLDGFL